MRLFINVICLLVLILLLGCKAKTEQLKTEEPVETKVTNSTDTTTVEEVPIREVKTPVTKVQTEKVEAGKPVDKTELVEPAKISYKITFLERCDNPQHGSQDMSDKGTAFAFCQDCPSPFRREITPDISYCHYYDRK